MSTPSLSPATESELATWTRTLAAAVVADPARFGVSLVQAQAFAEIDAVWQAAYGRAINPETRTRSAVAAKNVSKKNVRRAARDLAAIIRADPTMSAAKLAEVDIRPRATRERIGPPTTAPVISVAPAGPTNLRVRVYDAGPLKRARPHGVKGLILLKHIGPTPPAALDEWRLACTTHKTRFTIDFGHAIEPGAIVWLGGYWVNARLEAGPEAPIVSIRLPGSIQAATHNLSLAA